jgi:hypothetical protein
VLPVFNITVDGEHEYFASGVLVSNCDAALYAYRHLTHYLNQGEVERPAPGTPAHAAAEEAAIEAAIDSDDAPDSITAENAEDWYGYQ